MKVIDKTPFQDEKGNFGLRQRVQAGMEYGFSWQAEVKAQKPVITQLERVLEKPPMRRFVITRFDARRRMGERGAKTFPALVDLMASALADFSAAIRPGSTRCSRSNS